MFGNKNQVIKKCLEMQITSEHLEEKLNTDFNFSILYKLNFKVQTFPNGLSIKAGIYLC